MDNPYNLPAPQQIEYQYDIVDGPMVPNIWFPRRKEILKVDRVTVTVGTDGTISATAYGWRVNKRGARDMRFNTRDMADISTCSKYIDEFVRQHQREDR